MLTANQHQRISRKCAAAIMDAIDALPNMLKEAEPEKAAAIVADLIKTCLVSPMPQEDPGAALARIVKLAKEETARRHAEEEERTHTCGACGETQPPDPSVHGQSAEQPPPALTGPPEHEPDPEPEPIRAPPPIPRPTSMFLASPSRLSAYDPDG